MILNSRLSCMCFMLFIVNNFKKLAKKLYPVKSIIFYISFVFLFVLIYQLLFSQEIKNEGPIEYLVLFLWTIVLYLFINLFGHIDENKTDKTGFLYTIFSKIKNLCLYFFIIVFIVLFFLSAFYTIKVMNV